MAGGKTSRSSKSKVLALLRAAGETCDVLDAKGARALRIHLGDCLVGEHTDLAKRLTMDQAVRLSVAFNKGRGRNAKGAAEGGIVKKHEVLAVVLSEIIGEPVAESSIARYLRNAK